MRDETEISIATAKELGEKYDRAIKQFFRNKEAIAPVLKYAVREYADYSTEDIIRFIDADTISADTPVDDVPANVRDAGTEMSSAYEKIIHYDLHLKAKNPALSGGSILVMLHIIFEVQNSYRPSVHAATLQESQGKQLSYPVIRRGIYYTARELSSQLGTLTGRANYADLEKVVSIWVCSEDIPKALQNTMTRYSIKREDIIGKNDEPEADFDLMEVVIIRRGESPDLDEKIFDYLEGVFTSDIEKIGRYIDVDRKPEIREEVEAMWTGFGDSLVRKGMSEGIKEGKMERDVEILKKQIRSGLIKNTDDAKVYFDYLSNEQIQQIFNEVHGLQPV